MVKLDDTLELLLPRADAVLARRACDLVRFLRLLTADARSEPADRVGLDLERAKGEFENGVRRRLRHALVALLQSHLAHACGADSFAWFGAIECEVDAAWSLIEEARAEQPWMPGVPAPGEHAVCVAARVLDAARRLDPGAWEWELWGARLSRAQHGVRAGEEAFRAGLERSLDPETDPARCASWLAGLCECLLDRGAPREARAALHEARERVLADARLCQLLGWTRLLLGDASGARALLGSRRAPDAPLPGPLHELRARRPEWAVLLPQRFADREDEPASTATSGARRTQIGASVCLAISIDAAGACCTWGAEVAPALAAGLDLWLAQHLARVLESGTAEQRMLREHKVVFVHAPEQDGPERALGGEQTLARALVPILAARGELVGWVHLEFEHHLLPRPAPLSHWARETWSAFADRRSREREVPAPPRPALGRESDGRCFQGLIDDLGLRGALLRWSGYVLSDGVPQLVAEGGDGNPAGNTRALARGLLQRVLLGGGHVRVDGQDPSLGLHAGTRSALALALRWGERTSGALLCESAREGGFLEAEAALCPERVAAAALALDLERFSDAHREQHGAEIWFDSARADFRDFAGRLLRAAPSPSAVLLCGAPGSGKTVLARWLHSLSPRSCAPLVTVHSLRIAGPEVWNDCLRRAGSGSLLVEHVDRLEPALQELLLEWLELTANSAAADERPRLLATTSDELAACVQPGRLGLGLARELQHVSFGVPALAARRQEIVPLARRLLARLARVERRRVPELEDEAWGMVWRQPWPGNLRELSAFLHRLVLFASAPVVSADHLEEIGARFGLRLRARIPSRHPSRADLQGALASTLLGTGRVNKTRAAAYLGWDPDTLVARLTSLGLDAASPQSHPAWTPLVEVVRSSSADEELGAETNAR